MSRSYGAITFASGSVHSVFAPHTLPASAPRTVAMVNDLPAVKDQGSLPVCSAVVAVTMYEQLLLRENLGSAPQLPSLSQPPPRGRRELGWAWVYISGRRLLQAGAGSAIHEQLLAGLPLAVALDALIKDGVLADETEGLLHNNPIELERQLQQLSYTPRGVLATPLRILAVIPTADAIYEALRAQYVVGFALAVDCLIDAWMHSKEKQEESGAELPSPLAGSPRLATHAAAITAIDMGLQRVTVQNSFGSGFGIMGFFFIPLRLLLRPEFSNLQFFILLRAG